MPRNYQTNSPRNNNSRRPGAKGKTLRQPQFQLPEALEAIAPKGRIPRLDMEAWLIAQRNRFNQERLFGRPNVTVELMLEMQDGKFVPVLVRLWQANGEAWLASRKAERTAKAQDRKAQAEADRKAVVDAKLAAIEAEASRKLVTKALEAILPIACFSLGKNVKIEWILLALRKLALQTIVGLQKIPANKRDEDLYGLSLTRLLDLVSLLEELITEHTSTTVHASHYDWVDRKVRDAVTEAIEEAKAPLPQLALARILHAKVAGDFTAFRVQSEREFPSNVELVDFTAFGRVQSDDNAGAELQMDRPVRDIPSIIDTELPDFPYHAVPSPEATALDHRREKLVRIAEKRIQDRSFEIGEMNFRDPEIAQALNDIEVTNADFGDEIARSC